MSPKSTLSAYLHSLPGARCRDAEQELLLSLARLEYRPEDAYERRSIDMAVFSDGRVEATSIKLYNVFRFPQLQFQGSVLKLMLSAAAISTLQPVATILGLLALIQEFLGQSAKAYSELDAQVLLAIYRLGRICHISTIPGEYRRLFGKELEEEKLRAALALLSDYRSVEVRGEEVELIENINISRQ